MTKEEKLARKQQRKAEKVGLGKLLLWNSSSCSVALSTLMLGYVTFYCTDVLQLAPALVGTLFMVSKIFDSFTDIVAGFIVDRTQTRWGKGRPYEIFMLFLWLSTWLLFSCPTSFATAAKCIWIFCIHHLRKQAASDPFDQISGSNGLMGAADTTWVMQRKRTSKNADIILTGRDLDRRTLYLHEENCIWLLDEEETAEEQRLKAVPEYLWRVAEYIE